MVYKYKYKTYIKPGCRKTLPTPHSLKMSSTPLENPGEI